jgi:predicted ATPase
MLPLRINELRLKNYRAFASARLDFDPITFLIGRNGAGKSTLMDALEFLSESIVDSLDTALERRGNLEGLRRRSGTARQSDVSVAVLLQSITPFWFRHHQAVYGFRIGSNPKSKSSFRVKGEYLRDPSGKETFEREGNEFRTDVPQIKPGLDSGALVLPTIARASPLWNQVYRALSSISVHQFSTRMLRQEPEIGGPSRLTRDGSNAGDVLRNTKSRDVEWIVRHLSEITPGITKIEAAARAGRRVIVFHQTGPGNASQVFDASVMSDGTVRSLAILLSLTQSPKPSIVGIDEIEDSLHPHALNVILDAIHWSAETTHVPIVVSTHNPEVLSHPTALPVRIRVVQWDEGTSRLFRLSDTIISDLKPPQSVGRLLRSNALWTDKVPLAFAPNADIFQVR